MHRKFEKHCSSQTRILTNVLPTFLLLTFACGLSFTFMPSLPDHAWDPFVMVISNITSSMGPFPVISLTRQTDLQNACQALMR